MSIAGFDYKEFAKILSSQADELIPAGFQDFQKQYIINTVRNFSELSGEAIANDEQLKFNADQAMLITQIIAEWSFHKSIDVVNSGILPDYWDSVMQKIAFTIFEIAKQTISKGITQDEILKIVEHQVKKTYQEAIEDLKKRGIIDETVFDNALKQSNIDAMMQQMQNEKAIEENAQVLEEIKNQSNSKILKLASVALLLKELSQDKVQSILNKFSQQDAQTVIQYMQTPDLEHKVDKSIAMKCLQEIKFNLPEPKFINPDKIITKINEIVKKSGKENVERILIQERSKVRTLIQNAKEGEDFNISPKVANIIASHLEESLL